MNRNKLKSYAPKARRDFISAVTDRAAKFGITENRIELTHEQGDAVVILGTPYPRAVGEQRKKLMRRIEINGFAQVMEEIAYTWFNRIAAIRFMEVNGYLDHGLRVLSHPAGKTIPEILEKAELAGLPGFATAKVLEMKLDGRADAELYRLLLVAQCNALHKAMPFLFERIDDETELLLPDNLLHSDSVIRQLVDATDEADWREIEIIGWLYQFYIAEKKDQVIGKVVRSEDIPAATQLFTPNWIVKYMVQNSLGAKWLATYPDSALKAKMEYYIQPAEQRVEVQAKLAEITPKSLDPEAITLMDPACGSGHILIEAYNLFREIYLERGYQTRDIPRLILERNLYGLEICDRAAQLAGFAVLMRARRDDAKILENPPKLNILAIQSSKGLDAREIARELLREERVELVPSGDLLPETLAQPTLPAKKTAGVTEQDIRELLALFEDAKTFGSLIQVPQATLDRLLLIEEPLGRPAPTDLLRRHAFEEANERLGPLAAQTKLLGRRYDCVVANPPYMGAKYFCTNLSRFINEQYTISKADIYGCFMLASLRLAKSDGYVAHINIPAWLMNSTFADFRAYLLDESTIASLIHNGRGVFGSDFGSCSFVLRKWRIDSFIGVFKRLFSNPSEVNSNIELSRKFFSCAEYRVQSSDFDLVPGKPISYWVSSRVRKNYANMPSISALATACQGISTSDDSSFVRLWHEVAISNINFRAREYINNCHRWVPYNKGGEIRKWYGNIDFVVEWQDNGGRIKARRPKAVIRNERYYFIKSISWQDYTIGVSSFRMYPDGFIFATNAHSAFIDREEDFFLVLGLCNSSALAAISSAVTPGLHFNSGYFSLVPFDRKALAHDPTHLVKKAVHIAKEDYEAFETSWEFKRPPTLSPELRNTTCVQAFAAWQNKCDANIREGREIEEENNRIFIDAYGLQDELTPEVPEDQITLARAEREADIQRLISYAVGCMMGRYSLDEPGLIYAHAGNAGFDPGRYKTFAADADGIVPVTDLDWFADDAANRFVEFVKVAWPAATLAENLTFVAESLGAKSGETAVETIRRYLSQSFFKDHLQTYKRRPVYWLFSSGREKAFEGLVYLHRYNEGTLARLRMDYVTPLMSRLRARIEQLEDQAKAASSTAATRKLEKTRTRMRSKQTELVAFDEKLRHYADQRIALDLDDGVKVNYAKFGDLLAEVKAVTGQKEE